MTNGRINAGSMSATGIYDVYGRLICEQATSETYTSLDLSELSGGVYLLKVNHGDSKTGQRMVKTAF